MPHRFVGFLFVLSGVCLAQNQAAFRSNVELVVVPVTVVDRSGAAVPGLNREDFRVYDNDARRVIESFAVDDDQPLTLGVLIDESESQKELAAEHRRTATQLLERMQRPGDQSFVFSVGELSPLWNAVYDAARNEFQTRSGNKALVMLTDGFDSSSTYSWQQAADAAGEANARIYAIQYRSASGRDYAPDLYRLIADAGGAWFTAREANPAAVAERIETDLRHRYVLGFRPEELSGKARHSIRVEVTRPELTVRARKTYVR